METQIKNTELIGKYISLRGYSDIYIRGKVIGSYGKTGIMIQRINAIKDLVKKEWKVGGFSGVCLNNHNQEWEFEITNTIIRDRVCLLYTSPSPRDYAASRMPSSA